MRHPSENTLRRLVDEPAGVADADRTHVATCVACRATVAHAAEDTATVASLLGHRRAAHDIAVAGDVDVDAAWARLSVGLREGASAPRSTAPGGRGRAWRRPAFAVAATVALIGGAGVAAAADWLPIFRTERIEPIVFDPRALMQLPDLSAYGELTIVDEVELSDVVSAAEAAEATGLDAPDVASLPNGVIGEPEYRFGSQATAVFTFSDEAAQAAVAAAAAGGATLPPPPAGLDGSQFRLVAGPGIAAVWREARGIPALFVGRATAPTGYSNGVPFETARDYLLTIPGLPDELAAQLRAFSPDGSTLPLPIGDPDGSIESSEAEVGDAPATVVRARGGSMAGVVWVDDGIVTVVAGLLDVDEVLTVARGLR